MSLKSLQPQVDEWIRTHTPGYFEPLMMIARLTEELGELSRAVSHHHGGKRPKPGEEPGDIASEIGQCSVLGDVRAARDDRSELSTVNCELGYGYRLHIAYASRNFGFSTRARFTSK